MIMRCTHEGESQVVKYDGERWKEPVSSVTLWSTETMPINAPFRLITFEKNNFVFV